MNIITSWQSKLGVIGIVLCIVAFYVARTFYDLGWFTAFYLCVAITAGYVGSFVGYGFQQIFSTNNDYFKSASLFDKIFYIFCISTLFSYVMILVWATNKGNVPLYYSFVAILTGLIFYNIGFKSLERDIELTKKATV